MRIDLNADIGESFGAFILADDAGLIRAISSANIACGYHAGDPGVMRATVELAAAHGVAIGAHPSLPDLTGFGRREMRVTPREATDLVIYQIGALAAFAAAAGARLRHVKPHGALYNMAARDAALADAIAAAVAAVDRSLILFGLAGSALVEAGRRAGLRTASEAFADRGYGPDGRLVPREREGALIHDAAIVSARVLGIVRDQVVVAVDGTGIPLRAETICLHSDTPGAVALATCVRAALEREGIQVRAVGEP
jgi:5-oxoprolinase (ATP-hydrolysing) subunit A